MAGKSTNKTAKSAKSAAKAAKPRKAGARSSARKPTKGATKSKDPAGTAKPILLSGGNPQIAKADGDAPVQAYVAAMPGWKSGVGRRLDALIARTVPRVHKAVKWNSPFYRTGGQGWFLSFHCFTKYIKVVFFRGGSSSCPSRRVQGQGSALLPHLRGQPAQRGARDELDQAGSRAARLGLVAPGICAHTTTLAH